MNPVRGHGPAEHGAPARPAPAAARGPPPRPAVRAVRRDRRLPRPEPAAPPADRRAARARSRTPSRDLSDEGGLVEPATLERFGLTSASDRTLVQRIDADRAARCPGAWPPGVAAGALMLAALETLGPDAARVEPRRGRGAPRSRRRSCRGSAGSAAAACLVGWLASPEAGPRGHRARAGGRPRAGPVPAPARGRPVVRPGARAAARRGRARAALRRARGALLDGLAPRRPGRRGLLVARRSRRCSPGDALLFGIADGTAPRAEWEGSFQRRGERRALPAALLARDRADRDLGRARGRAPVRRARALARARPAGRGGVGRGARGGARRGGGSGGRRRSSSTRRAGAVGGAILAVVVAVAAAAVGLAARPVEQDPLP